MHNPSNDSYKTSGRIGEKVLGDFPSRKREKPVPFYREFNLSLHTYHSISCNRYISSCYIICCRTVAPIVMRNIKAQLNSMLRSQNYDASNSNANSNGNSSTKAICPSTPLACIVAFSNIVSTMISTFQTFMCQFSFCIVAAPAIIPRTCFAHDHPIMVW